jgi:hypothetical protein
MVIPAIAPLLQERRRLLAAIVPEITNLGSSPPLLSHSIFNSSKSFCNPLTHFKQLST